MAINSSLSLATVVLLHAYSITFIIYSFESKEQGNINDISLRIQVSVLTSVSWEN